MQLYENHGVKISGTSTGGIWAEVVLKNWIMKIKRILEVTTSILPGSWPSLWCCIYKFAGTWCYFSSVISIKSLKNLLANSA
ncbi:hypothetical protein RCL_jg21055.t2 [Rhizophagus clarus]|uniref:Uncharacterized protein n=1 Tax=Rhizophagus clarus TaxID=94130 RepID=A0A8H3M840_9GLOM|nr:hypothetical protein RCL_jg21055.t2 [Rhizophagus clarus]